MILFQSTPKEIIEFYDIFFCSFNFDYLLIRISRCWLFCFDLFFKCFELFLVCNFCLQLNPTRTYVNIFRFEQEDGKQLYKIGIEM